MRGQRGLHLNYHLKQMENNIFIENLLNKKVCIDILRCIFDFYENILLQASLKYFHPKESGSLSPQAVRIRVNIVELFPLARWKKNYQGN
jgi:hypothetical protein